MASREVELLISAMGEMRRTARLLQCCAVGGKIGLDHFQIKGNDDKADDIEAYLRETQPKELLNEIGLTDDETDPTDAVQG
jgi:hypothetical protein